MSAAVTAVELLKALRNRELSRTELADELGLGFRTITNWVEAWTVYGVLELRLVPGRGAGQRLYRLAPAWVREEP